VIKKRLTTLRQHALLHLVQLFCALSQLHGGLEGALPGPGALPTRHTAVAPVRPRSQHAGDGVCTGTSSFIQPVSLFKSES